MIYCFDIDGTICTYTDGNYAKAIPIDHRIQHINQLIAQGMTVIFYTARGAKTGIDWTEFTQKQLITWGILNPIIFFGKPIADLYIDDRGISDQSYNWDKLS